MWNVQRDRPTTAADYASARRQTPCRSHRRPERDVQAQRFHRVQSVTQPCETVRRARVKYVQQLSRSVPGQEIGRQLLRSGTGVSADGLSNEEVQRLFEAELLFADP